MLQRRSGMTYHGGLAWNPVSGDASRLVETAPIIPGDVLDAWFSPAPPVSKFLKDNAELLCRTSPPVFASGLIEAIAQVRKVTQDSIVLGAGSSALIFQSFQNWFDSSSRILLLDPAYGEYRHVLERITRSRIVPFFALKEDGFELDLAALVRLTQKGDFDAVVLVNPNNPTGKFVGKSRLVEALAQVPKSTLIWIDETYVDFVDGVESLESEASTWPNLVVCKSLSKSLALSGLRTGYLVTHPERAAKLRETTPPWAISLPAQAATIIALGESAYYGAKYEETHQLRVQLSLGLRDLGFEIVDGCANFLLGFCPGGMLASELCSRCETNGFCLRNASGMGVQLGPSAVRFAVRSNVENERMLEVLSLVTGNEMCRGKYRKVETLRR